MFSMKHLNFHYNGIRFCACFFRKRALFKTLCVQFGGQELRQEDQSAESVKNQMTVQEWEKVFEMSQDKNLYHNLCTSLFPTIHGVL